MANKDTEEARRNLIDIIPEDCEELSSSPDLTTSSGPSKSYETVEIEPIIYLADEEDDVEIYTDEEIADADDTYCDEHSEDFVSDIESNSGLETESEYEDEEDSSNHDEEWTLHKRGGRPPVFTSKEEVRGDASASTPFDFFKLLFTETLLQQIVEATNKCATQLMAESTGPHARIRRWKSITVDDLLTFLGILFHMGDIQVNRFSDYWRHHHLYNLFACKFMSRNKFLIIFRCLRFGQYNLDSLIAYFNNKMGELYSPGEELCIDESIILRRGRSRFRQYAKSSGTKLHILATPSGISVKVHLYGGRKDQDLGGKGHKAKVVVKLMDQYLGTGRHLFMDDYYNSVSLSEFLLRNGTNVTGTLKPKRIGNPAVLATRLQKGGSIFRYNRMGVCVCKWRDHRDILAISTTYSPELIPETNSKGQHILKPQMVTQYNKFSDGVDKQEQTLILHYTCDNKSMRWYKKVGIHILQMMMLNAYYLYQLKTKTNTSFYDFRESVKVNLLPPPPPSPSGTSRGLVEQVTESIIHLPVHLPRDDKHNTKRRRCKHCWDTKKIRRNTLIYCPTCHKQPGLCLECFRPFHKY